MLSKLFFASLVSMLAMSAFSADTQTGRYRIEGPGWATGSGLQAGRYSIDSGNNWGYSQYQYNTMQNNQGLMAGRYEQNMYYAPSSSYMREYEYAGYRTERGQARDVSNRPYHNYDRK